VIRRIKYHDRESWLRERRRGIGGSDIGAILGLSRWRSPLDVYLDKIGEAEEQESSDAMYWGTILESVVADEYARRTGSKVRKINAILAREDEPWRRASVDRLVIGERKILECKTAGAHMCHEWGPDGSDEVPDVYRAQVAWYQHVLDHDDADLAVLIGGRDYRIYHLPRDRELERLIVSAADNFWLEHVRKKVPPDPICDRDLSTLYAVDNGQALDVTSDGDAIAAVQRLADVSERIRRLEASKKAIRSEIAERMRDYSVLTVGGEPILTYKAPAPSARVDYRAVVDDLRGIIDDHTVDLLISSHTEEQQGARRMLIKIKSQDQGGKNEI